MANTAASSVTENRSDDRQGDALPNDRRIFRLDTSRDRLRKCLSDIVLSRTGMPSLNKNQTIPARPASVRRAKKRRDPSKMKSLMVRFTRRTPRFQSLMRLRLFNARRSKKDGNGRKAYFDLQAFCRNGSRNYCFNSGRNETGFFDETFDLLRMKHEVGYFFNSALGLSVRIQI